MMKFNFLIQIIRKIFKILIITINNNLKILMKIGINYFNFEFKTCILTITMTR